MRHAADLGRRHRSPVPPPGPLLGNSYIHITVRDGRPEVRGAVDFEVGLSATLSGEARPAPGYARWEWDGETLAVVNCRYGLRPLFYFARENEVCLSPSIPQLLRQGADAALDEPALAVFVRLGTYVGNDTPFRAIRAVPPNSTFRWTRRGVEVADRPDVIRPKVVSRDDAIDEFNHLFDRAIARCAPSRPFILPLSGGRDSRHILFGLLKAGHRPAACVTARHYPPRSNDDERVAGILARTLGIEHVVLDQGRSRVMAEMEKNKRTNFCAVAHAWTVCLADWLSGRTSLVYDGIGGDLLSGSVFQDDQKVRLAAAGDVGGLADSILDTLTPSEIGLETMLGGNWSRRLNRHVARARLIAELVKHLDAPLPLTSFLFWNRLRRMIAQYTFAMIPPEIDVNCPFLDPDLYDHLMAVPAELLGDHRFHADAIHRAYPAYKHIPFDDPRASQQPAPAHWRRFGRDLTVQLLRQGPSGIVDRRSLIPHLIRCALTGNGEKEMWLQPLVALYLSQLEAMARGVR